MVGRHCTDNYPSFPTQEWCTFDLAVYVFDCIYYIQKNVCFKGTFQKWFLPHFLFTFKFNIQGERARLQI